MTELEVLRPFVGKDGRMHEVGERIQYNDSLAQDIVGKGFAKKVEEALKETPAPAVPTEKRGPIFQHRMNVSKTRNLTLEVWPPYEGSKFDTPSVSLVDGRLSDKNQWENTRIYLSWGILLELSEMLRKVWHDEREAKQ